MRKYSNLQRWKILTCLFCIQLCGEGGCIEETKHLVAPNSHEMTGIRNFLWNSYQRLAIFSVSVFTMRTTWWSWTKRLNLSTLISDSSRHAGHWSPTDENENWGIKTVLATRLDSTRLIVYEYEFPQAAILSKPRSLCRVFASLIGIFSTRQCWWARTLRIVTIAMRWILPKWPA